MHLFVKEDNVLTAFVSVIKHDVKTHGPLVYFCFVFLFFHFVCNFFVCNSFYSY